MLLGGSTLRSSVWIRSLVCNRHLATSPLHALLTDTKTYFKDSPSIAAKVDSVLPIVPQNDKYVQFQPAKLTVGLISSHTIPPGLLLDCLIQDPLGGDNTWMDQLDKYRQSHPKNNIRVTYANQYLQTHYSSFGVKAPFLNKDLRLVQPPHKRETFNDIDLIDIRNLEFKNEHTPVEDIPTLNMGTSFASEEIKPTDCQLYVYVRSRSTEEIYLGWIGRMEYPYLLVLNKSESVQSAPQFQLPGELSAIEVDLTKMKKANDVLAQSPKNVDQYVELVNASNSKRLLSVLEEETSGYKPLILLLQSLLRDIRTDLVAEGELSPANTKAAQLRQQVLDWAQNSHLELQSKVGPYMDEVIVNKFTKLGQAVWNSDELALVISSCLFDQQSSVKPSLFSKTALPCHGYLMDSEANLNYLGGAIDATLPDGFRPPNSAGSSPLTQLKFTVIQERLPELQGTLNRVLVKETTNIIVPTFCITTLGYIFSFIDLNTMGAITAFSIALAAYKASGKIYKEVVAFKNWYLEQLRVSIDRSLVYLNGKLEENLNRYGSHVNTRQHIADRLDGELSKLQAAQEKLHHK